MQPFPKSLKTKKHMDTLTDSHHPIALEEGFYKDIYLDSFGSMAQILIQGGTIHEINISD